MKKLLLKKKAGVGEKEVAFEFKKTCKDVKIQECFNKCTIHLFLNWSFQNNDQISSQDGGTERLSLPPPQP